MSSSKNVGITFQVPRKVYYGLKKYLNLDNDTLSRLFGAAAINRFIDLGYLNEFGEPIEIIEPKLESPKSCLDLNNPTSITSLRSLAFISDYLRNKK